ncbi:MAG TPA: transposase [Acidimicrobiales bacterium]|nr:transposase [Acidimicrobiales bacterium]
MAFTYPTAFRENVCERMLEGERVEDLAAELEVAAGTLFHWKKQALIDVGRRPGIRSYEPDELARARRRIRDLEAELELVKAAGALFDGKEVIRPKGSARSVNGMQSVPEWKRLRTTELIGILFPWHQYLAVFAAKLFLRAPVWHPIHRWPRWRLLDEPTL